MRYVNFALAGVVLTTSLAAAQQPSQQQQAQRPAGQAAPQTPPAQSQTSPPNPRLDALLLNWEQQMTKIQTIVAHCTRTSVDKTFQVAEVYEGTAQYMKPNLASLEMRKKDKPQIFEKYICSGTFLYEYAPAEKVIRVHELPPSKPGQVAEDNFLSFLFGMRAEEAKRRYDLKLVKEDQWYVYIEILARFPADKQDFQRARLVLNSKTFLPRELWFEQPNGNEVKWDIPKLESNLELRRTDFTAPTPPPGWKLIRMPRATEGAAKSPTVPPRVVRPKQPN